MKINTIAVFLLAATLAHAAPPEHANNDKEKIANEEKEIAEKLKASAGDLHQAQVALENERGNLRGGPDKEQKDKSDNGLGNDDCDMDIKVLNSVPLAPGIAKEKCPELWKKFYQMEDEYDRQEMEHYAKPVAYSNGVPQKPDCTDGDDLKCKREQLAFKKAETEFERKQFANYNPNGLSGKKGNPGRGKK